MKGAIEVDMFSDLEINYIKSDVRQFMLKGKEQKINICWQGASGRIYEFTKQNLEDFTLLGKDIYVLIANDRPVWVGNANDLINDEISRASFKKATGSADCVFYYRDNSDELTKMGIINDIKNGRLSKSATRANIKLLA